MKFARCEWSWRNLAGWTPRRNAAARRAVEKERAKVEAKRAEVALFPEMQAEIQPRFSTEDERKEIIDRHQEWITEHTRREHLAMWRKARAAYYSLPPLRRRGIRRLWNRSSVPKGPYSFATFVHQYSKGGQSPWTYLRKIRLMWLWNHGGWPRPTHFRVITANFSTLGPVKHPRLLTQSFIHLAQLQGISLRQVHANRIPKHNRTTIYR